MKSYTSTPPKTYSLPNPWKLGCLIFCLYDTVHLFKNIYNNWANKKLFICPNVDENGEKSKLKPNFHHLQELYELEHGMFPKMAHKLIDNVLHPQSIEKTNVSLADAAFHKSTMNALNYYAKNGYQHFEDTAVFIKIMRDWFNALNVKSVDYGTKTCDERRKPIRQEHNSEQLSFLRSMA